MKRKWMPLESMLLSLGCAWGGVGCLVSAFDLKVTLLLPIGGMWLLWAAVCALVLPRRHGGLLPTLAVLAAAGYAGYDTALRKQVFCLLGIVARVYDSGYGWGIPSFLQVETGPVDIPLALLGAVLIYGVSWAVCRRRGSGAAVAALSAPLAACLVMTDTVPDTRYLFVLLAGMVLLLLTACVRQESGNQGTRLCGAALIPTAAALGLLFCLVPQESYVNTSGALREALAAYAERIPEKLETGQLTLPGFGKPRQKVDLSSLSAQPQLRIPVAEVSADLPGTVYLRSQDYDQYTGVGWISDPNRQETLAGMGESRGVVNVQVLNSQTGLLLPSFPDGEVLLTGGMALNDDGLQEYTFSCKEQLLGPRPGESWLQLPENTASGVRELLSTVIGGLSTTEEIALAIGDYVRESGIYDRETRAMPGGREDFALWFLQEAERGYCVHFATAAAVLLRGAGIPARYVTGYKAEITGQSSVRITSNDAHAWVEYYNYQTWTWKILEATPGELSLSPEPDEPETVTEPTPTQSPQSTQPETPRETAAPMPEEQKPIRRFPWEVLLGLLAAAGGAGAAEGQRLVRIWLRRRHQSRGTANDRAAVQWQQLLLCFRLLGTRPPEELEQLTEKAVFSQHLLTEEELGRFSDCAAASRRTLRRRRWYERLVYRYWYAVI